MTFVHSSDWHLSTLTWKHRVTLTGDSLFSLQQLVDFCIDNGCPLIAAGDLFDSESPDSGAVAGMCRQMDRMQAAGLPVFFTQGQHERRYPPWMSVHPHPTHVHQAAFGIAGMRFYGLDWTAGAEVQSEFAKIPDDTDILVCHQVWSEHMGSLTNPECSVRDVPYARYILTGDYHQHQVTTHDTSRGPVTMFSAGSMSMRNLAEPPEKMFWYCFDGGVDSSGRRQLSYRSVRLKTRQCLKVRIDSSDQLDKLVSLVENLATIGQLPPELSKPLCEVSYPAEFADGYRKITSALDGKAHWWLKLLEESKEDLIRFNTVIDSSKVVDATLSACLDALVESDSAIKPDTLQLLESPRPPATVLDEIVQRWGAEIDASDKCAIGELVPAPRPGNEVAAGGDGVSGA